MIETIESREQFQARREVAQAAMRHALKGELPIDVPKSNQVLRKPLTLDKRPKSNEVLRKTNVNQGFNRKDYQREYMKTYRQKLKLCPHCGKDITT